ncbi:hypothetical protein MHU86_6913 [Fragilaria crotonensis]|nr:hypothetical protein MHU86_6913 [Fragilaria crotonensis]
MGFEVQDHDQECVLKCKKDLFGQKQAGKVWNQHLVNKLKEVGFILSEIDECLFYKMGFEVQDHDQECVLKCKKDRTLFGQKQAGRVWNQHLVNNKLKEVGFILSEIDDCLFYKGKLVFVLYIDDSILAGPDLQELYDTVQEMDAVGLNFTVEGDIPDFLGVQIDRINDNTFNLSQQPHLINDVLKELHLDGPYVAIKKTTGSSSKTQTSGFSTFQ